MQAVQRFQLLLQTIALYAISFVIAFGITYTAADSQVATTVISDIPTAVNPYMFILTFFVASAVAYLLVKTMKKKKNFWKVFFGLGAFAGMFITLYYLCLYVISSEVSYGISIALTIIVILARAATKRVWLHNIVVILAVAGVARLLGHQFTPYGAAIILGVLSLYDIAAVYLSKHMVTMAKTLFDRQAFFGLIIPHQYRKWNAQLTALKPGEQISVIGAGDIALPLFFALSHLLYNGLAAFVIVSIAIGIGVIAMHHLYTVTTKGKPIPALPPIVFLAFIGHFIVSLFL